MTATDAQMRAAAVRTIAATATVAGNTHDPVDVSIDREIATQVPEGVAGGGGMVKAQGSVVLNDPTTPATSVITTRTSPWMPVSGWPPSRSQDATVDLAVDDKTPRRRFTGRVARVIGSAKDTTTVSIEDLTDNLKVDFSHYPMIRTMPPPGNQTGNRLNVSIKADWLADKVMRRAGFNTTPQVMGMGALNIPAQGSMWPQVGVCSACSQYDGTDNLPSWYPAPWGWAVANVDATYSAPNFGNQTLRGRVLAQGMMVDSANSAGMVRMDTRLGTATLTTSVTAAGNVEMRWNSSVIASPRPPAGYTRIEVIWRANGTIRMHTDTGWSRDFSWSPNAAVLDGAYLSTEVRVAPDGRGGGFVVQFAPTSYSGGYTNVTLNAQIVPGTLLTQMRAMPSLTSRDGLNLLQEISESLIISMWIDEDGKLWWVHPDMMRNQAPVATLTSDADLIDVAWEDNADMARRSVTLTYSDPTIRIKPEHRLLAWQGSGDNLKQGESNEEIIGPATDEDWVEVDTIAGGDAIYATPYPSNKQSLPDFNRGIGSWVGGTHLNKDGDSPQTLIEDDPENASSWAGKQNFPNLQRSMSRIGPAAWKLSTGLEDIGDNTWVEIQQQLDPVQKRKVPNLADPVGSLINNSWTGQKLPIIRCKGITTWADASYESTITGPSRYEEMVHDAGPWVGTGYKLLADWLAEQLTTPAPILRDLPVVYRSDLRLGNVVDIVEDTVYRVKLRVLIIGVSERHSEGNAELTLTGRVIDATALSWTYDQLAALGLTYDELEARDGTYEELSIPPANLTTLIDIHRQAGEQVEQVAAAMAAPAATAARASLVPPDIEVPDVDGGDAHEEGGNWTGEWVWPAPSTIPTALGEENEA